MNNSDISPMIQKAAARAPILWQRRRKILDAALLPETRSFAARLKESVSLRNAQLSGARERARNNLVDHGFKWMSFGDGEKMANSLKDLLQQGPWLRSSSRPINYLLHLLDTRAVTPTDIYERYITGGYPRNQTLPDDYKGSGLGNAAGDPPATRAFVDIYSSLTGSNQVTPEGEIMIIENTGNIGFLLAAARAIIFTGDEKLVLSLEMAFLWQSTYFQYGLRGRLGAHTHILSSPHFTDTLPGFRPPYGGANLTVAWIEGKSIQAGGSGCIECGLCMEFCPAVEVYGKAFSWHGYTGGIGILKAYAWEREKGAVEANAWMCNDCGKCSKVCPVDFDIFHQIRQVKAQLPVDAAFALQEKASRELISDYITQTTGERVDI